MEYLPAWMFLALTVLLMAGFPVTFTLLGTALTFGLIGFGWSFFDLYPLRVWGVMGNVTLMAVPLFVFMGVMLERSGLAEELLDTMGLLFGRLRGGLAIGVVVVGALLGASTGIVGATVVTMAEPEFSGTPTAPITPKTLLMPLPKNCTASPTRKPTPIAMNPI